MRVTKSHLRTMEDEMTLPVRAGKNDGLRPKWRLGLDLGTNSLGWAALQLDTDGRPVAILNAAPRIFSDGRDPKSGASNAVDRRDARAMRRRRDRFKQRQAALIKYLIRDGLWPADEAARKALETLDPYELRARALHERLDLPEVGRALFHLNQRRGFKSNRRADRKEKDSEKGKISVGVSRLAAAINAAGAETLGEFLHGRRLEARRSEGDQGPVLVPAVRTRAGAEGAPDEGEEAGFEFYPSRAMLEDEFDLILERQAEHHPHVLTQEVRERLFEIVFHQRPLRSPEVGLCTLTGSERRLPKAHPLFQKRRLLEEVNALRIVRVGEDPAPLTLQERDLLLLKLRDRAKVLFESLRKALRLDPDARFNKENENRRELKGDEIGAEFSSKKRFGPRWWHLSPAAQWEIVERVDALETEADEAALQAWLEERYELSGEAARAVVGARLPEGYGRFGPTATTRLVEALTAEVVVYSEAVEKAGLGHHSDFRTGEVLDALPYYGAILERFVMPGTGDPKDIDEDRLGRLTNPTVHIGLNQLRKIVNRLMAAHGKPAEIHLELARDLKMNEEEKTRANQRNRRNREAAAERSKKLIEIGQPDTGRNRAFLALWEELGDVIDRRCIYTGRQIGIGTLFSGEVDIDHILPFSRTLDDSNGNKVVCFREANRRKGNRTPAEAFGHQNDWDDILARAARLPPAKARRFEPSAMERFEREGGFVARQLIDTQYLSRLAREYLSSLYAERGEDSQKVRVVPGRLTEMLRRAWGLNSTLPDHNYGGSNAQGKNRLDHRHHAIDAIVVALTDVRLLQTLSRIAGAETLGEADRLASLVPDPWEGFRDDVKVALGAMTVSHKPDHGTAGTASTGTDATAGRLHNDTAYGLTGRRDARGNEIVVHRVPLLSLKPDDLSEGGRRWVADRELREALVAFAAGRPFEAALRAFPRSGPLSFRGVRRVRVEEPLETIKIRDAAGKPYKGYKGDSNYRYDVWELRDGKWTAEVVSMFHAHQPDWRSPIREANPTARKVLKLHQGDILAIERGEGRELMRVVKFGQNGQVTLAAPQESGDLKRRDAASREEDPFKYFAPTAGGLKRVLARQVRVDEIGRVFDPGPRSRPGTA